MTPEVPNPFQSAREQLDEAADRLGLDEGTRELLRWPMREITVTLPIRMDDGTTSVFRGHRVQYNNARGPTRGGLRWHPDETIDTVRAMASWMTWKTAALDLPLGGAHGGVACNPKELSETEKERLARAYVRRIGRVLGATRDAPSPDVYTTSQVMAWMMDEYEAMVEESHPGVTTGKPGALGGGAGWADATARGGVYALREAAGVLGLDLSGATAAIQGFGNAGQNAALLGAEILGLQIVAATDSRGGVYNPDGLDAGALVEHKLATGKVEGFPGAKPIDNRKIIELGVAVLFPAALEHVITEENASRIQAKICCELADAPVTPGADAILSEKGVFVIPDLLANAGGLVVSYFEQAQNRENYRWTPEEVRRRLDRTMASAFRAAWEMGEAEGVSMRLAALMVAVDRVAEACKLRGWV